MPTVEDNADAFRHRARPGTDDGTEWDRRTLDQGVIPESSEERVPRKLSARQRLDGLSAFRIRPKDINFTSSDPHGRGGKADVVKATFRREERADERLVAVKKHRYFLRIDKKKFANEYTHEVELMAGLSHENVIRLIGFVEDLDNGKAWIVLSWEPNGNVREFLATGNWEIPERISLIKDTFWGIKYLHTRRPPICHGDLKSFNILVSSSYRAIITDFGSARVISAPADGIPGDNSGQRVQKNPTMQKASTQIHVGAAGNQLTLTGPTWSLRWAAPEVLKGNPPALSSDMWAAGWICWELMTNKVPFSELNSDGVITLTVIQGEVPSPREDGQLAQVVALCSLMTDCWTLNPKARPNVSRCCEELRWMPSMPPLGGSCSGPKTPSSRLLIQMGATHVRQGRYEEAVSQFQQALSVAKSSGNEIEAATALFFMARAYDPQFKYGEAEDSYDRALEIYVRFRDEGGRANTLDGLGRVYSAQSKYIQAEGSLIQAERIYARLGDEQGRANTLSGLGDVYRLQSNYFQAKESYTRAHEIYTRLGDSGGRANTLDGIGQIYNTQSKYTQAEESFTQARDIYARLGDEQGRANALSGLGCSFNGQHNYTRAEEVFTQAQEIYARLGDEHGRANALSGLGDVYLLQANYIRAEESYARAYEIYARLGNDPGQANTLFWLMHIYHLQSKYIQADESFMVAEHNFIHHRSPRDQGNTLHSMRPVRQNRDQINQVACLLFLVAMIHVWLAMYFIVCCRRDFLLQPSEDVLPEKLQTGFGGFGSRNGSLDQLEMLEFNPEMFKFALEMLEFYLAGDSVGWSN